MSKCVAHSKNIHRFCLAEASEDIGMEGRVGDTWEMKWEVEKDQATKDF